MSAGGLTSSATCSLERYAPYLKRNGAREYGRQQRSDEVDVPWMPRVADLGKGINQGSLPVWLECNVEVDCRPVGCVSQTLPVYWNGVPGVLDQHLIPMYRGYYKVGEDDSD